MLETQEDIEQLAFPGTPVVLSSPVSQQSTLYKRLEKYGECLYGFVLVTDQMEKARNLVRGFGPTVTWRNNPVAWYQSEESGLFREINIGLLELKHWKG